MSRRDFQLIAGIIRILPVSDETRLRIAELFADHLVGTNPHFDRVRFIRACTGGSR